MTKTKTTTRWQKRVAPGASDGGDSGCKRAAAAATTTPSLLRRSRRCPSSIGLIDRAPPSRDAHTHTLVLPGFLVPRIIHPEARTRAFETRRTPRRNPPSCSSPRMFGGQGGAFGEQEHGRRAPAAAREGERRMERQTAFADPKRGNVGKSAGHLSGGGGSGKCRGRVVTTTTPRAHVATSRQGSRNPELALTLQILSLSLDRDPRSSENKHRLWPAARAVALWRSAGRDDAGSIRRRVWRTGGCMFF